MTRTRHRYTAAVRRWPVGREEGSGSRLGTRFVAASLTAVFLLVIQTGCGAIATRRTEFPNAVTTATGGRVFVEDIREIVDDALLTDADKVQALRDLGIEDDDLIQSLLTLP